MDTSDDMSIERMELLKSKAEEPEVIDEHKDIVVQEVISATDHSEIISVNEDKSHY